MVLLASAYDQSRFLRAEDLPAERKFRIKEVSEELVGQGVEQEKKLVVWFTNSSKGLVLNKTNNRVLRSAFGDDVAGWVKKIIALFPTTADFRGRLVKAMRVRIPAPKEAATKQLDGFAQPPEAAKPAAATTPAPAEQPEPDPDLDDEIPF